MLTCELRHDAPSPSHPVGAGLPLSRRQPDGGDAVDSLPNQHRRRRDPSPVVLQKWWGSTMMGASAIADRAGQASPEAPIYVGSSPSGDHPSRGADFDAIAFGARIKHLRVLRKMSLEEVGQAAGFTKSHIWELETGRSRNPTVRAIWSLAKALGVTPAHMLGISPDSLALHPAAMEVACIVDRAILEAEAR